MERNDPFAIFTNRMRRLPYVIWTGVLLAFAYTLLRAYMIGATGWDFVYPNGWQFLDPLGLIVGDGEHLWYAIGIHALLTIGLVITGMKRAQDAGWNKWIAALMVIPVVRLFTFTALAAAPSQQHTDAMDLPRARILDRLIPSTRTGSAVAAVIIAVLFVIPLGFIGVRVIENYGAALFLGLPFTLGALSAYFFNYHVTRSLKQSIGVALLAVSMAMLLIFAFAMEGLLCLVMAAPIVYAIAIPGAIVGHALSQNLNSGVPAMTLLTLLAPSFMAFEAMHTDVVPVFKVVTSVTVHAPQQEVWNELVAFSKMQEPDELLFLAGISYPVRATINGSGVGAVRYCEFNTGPFIEPITVWDEPHLLAFDVLDEPPPMTELSIYDHIDAPHVDGFFHSRNGQFRLVTNADGTTMLEGTTWYTHEIQPAWYWSIWSDVILHRIHKRVLDHIASGAALTTQAD